MTAASGKPEATHLALSPPLLATASRLLDRGRPGSTSPVRTISSTSILGAIQWFRFDPVILQQGLLAEAMARHPTWSTPYSRAPAPGFCRTGADDHPLRPIYPGRRIIGLLSIDIQTVTLAQTLHRLAPDWHPVPAQRPSADPRQQPVRYRAAPVRTAQSAEYEWQQGALQLVYPIRRHRSLIPSHPRCCLCCRRCCGNRRRRSSPFSVWWWRPSPACDAQRLSRRLSCLSRHVPDRRLQPPLLRALTPPGPGSRQHVAPSCLTAITSNKSTTVSATGWAIRSSSVWCSSASPC